MDKSEIVHIALFTLGLAILLLYIFHIGIYKIINTIIQIDARYFAMAIILRWVAFLFFVGTWSVLLGAMKEKVPFKKLFRLHLISNVFNFLIPSAGLSGEITKSYFVKSETDVSFSKAFASVELHRFFLVFPLLIGSIASLIALIYVYQLPRWVLLSVTFILLVTTLGLGLILVLFTNYRILRRITDLFISFLNFFKSLIGESRIKNIRLTLLKFSSILPRTLKNILSSPKKFSLALFLSILAWFFDLSTAYLTFAGFDYFPPMEIIILVNSLGLVVQMLPLGIPGMLGVTEVLMSELYGLAGMPIELSASVIILDRFITSWMPLLVGLLVFLKKR